MKMLRILTIYLIISLIAFNAGAQSANFQKEVSPRLVVQTAHSDWISTLKVSPDGKKIISASFDGTLRLWDAYSGRELHSFVGHTKHVIDVAFSPDGRTVVSGSRDNKVKLWDIKSHTEIVTINPNSNWITSVAFSPDGRSVVYGEVNNGKVGVLDTKTGKENCTATDSTTTIDKVVFSKDGKTFISGGLSLVVWDASTCKKLHVISERPHDAGQGRGVAALALCSDGATLASGGRDKTLKLWNIPRRQEIHKFLGHEGVVEAVAISPDCKTILSASSNKNIRMWDMSSGRTTHSHFEEMEITSIAYFPNGKFFVTGGRNNSFALWDAKSFKKIYQNIKMTSTVSSLAASPDENIIAFISGDQWDAVAAIGLWNTKSGDAHIFSDNKSPILNIAFSPNGRVLASGDMGKHVKLWDVDSKIELHSMNGHTRYVSSVGFASDGNIIISGGGDREIKQWDLSTGQEFKSRAYSGSGNIYSAISSRDGKRIISGGTEGVTITDVASGTALYELSWNEDTGKVAVSPDDSLLAIAGLGNQYLDDRLGSNKILLINSQLSQSNAQYLIGHNGAVTGIAFSPDGRTLVSSSSDRTLKIWTVDTGRERRTLSGHDGGVTDVVFSINGKYLFSSSNDKSIKLWRAEDGVLLATLIFFSNGAWVVKDPDGRFDTADLENMPHLHWVMPDDPFTPVPLEAFMKDYYEPRLLARIMAGEYFKPVRPLTSLNRTQPAVQITSMVSGGSDPSLVKVTVSATGATKSYQQGDKEVPRPTAVHDLRLFRDGQVVGYADGKLADFKGAAFSKTFTVRLPKDKAGNDVVFSAYAFNDDRVKSETVRSTYKAPALPASAVASKGKAYVISMGVNSHDNTAWNLNFAANDARLVRQSVSEKLAKSSQYNEVIAITLVSDNKDRQASKAALHAVLDRLAGKPLNAAATALLQTIQGADKLQTVTPDDLFLLSFSGHGFADDSGNFYLIPQDTGPGSGKAVTAELRQHSISSEELSQWLRDVDAGDMSMIVDACQSAATVGNDFKPGPMGSRGLGQLSFDKGMRILAASQSDEVALEDGRIQQGLLSYALVKDGLDQQKADHLPVDKTITLKEWLSYGVSRVPSLADDVTSGKLVAARGTVSVSADGKVMKTVTQQPSLFDFTKGRRDVVLEAGIH